MDRTNDCSRFPKLLMRYGNRMHRIDVTDKDNHSIEVSVWDLDGEIFLMSAQMAALIYVRKLG